MEPNTVEAALIDTTLNSLKRLVISVAELNLDPDKIGDHASIFDDCGIDSTSLVALVLSIEEKYGIRVTEDELEIEMFQDLSRLAQFIDAKLASPA